MIGVIYIVYFGEVFLVVSILSSLGFGHKRHYESLCFVVYQAIVKQARQPVLYGENGAPDSFDGRFDVLVLHMYLVLRRLKQDDLAHRDVGQILFDLFFDDMDQGLRERGVGDLSVGKKIRKMAESFYGRVAAYEIVFNHQDLEGIAKIIRRNLYSGDEDILRIEASKMLAHYAMLIESYLNQTILGVVLSKDLFKEVSFLGER